MARIRSIHPGFFTDEAFVQVSAHARLLFLGLGIEADDKGVFPWKPVTLKMRLFPMDVIDMQELLAELVKIEAIVRYRADDGKEYGAIRNFRTYQRPKSPNDLYPLPDDFRNYVGLSDDISEPLGKRSPKSPADGVEGRVGEDGGWRGEEGKSRARATQLPDDFQPVLTPHAQAIVDQWPPGMLEREVEKFRDYNLAKGATMKNWQAAFRTWVAKANEWKGSNGKSAHDSRDGFERSLDRDIKPRP